MKNIYDIIKSQKVETDVKFASYDLMYVTEHFLNNEELYYLEEGFNDTVKKVGKTIVKFIKDLIRRIGELIDKVINFFRRGKDDVQLLEDKINAANNGEKPAQDNKEDEDRERKEREERIKEYERRTEELKKQRDANREKYRKQEEERQRKAAEAKAKKEEEDKRNRVHEKAKKRAANLSEVLKNSKQKVSIKGYATLDQKMNLSNLFFKAVNAAAKQMVDKKVLEPDIYVNLVIDGTFKKGGSHNVNDGKPMPIEQRIKLELYEASEEKHELSVNVLADTIMNYLKNTDVAIKYLESQKRVATDTLNKLLGIASNLNENENKMLNMIKTSASIVAEFVNAMCRNITSTYSAYLVVAKKVTDDYSRSM